jgi:glycosyltransferase involved in cell wall biosynthesis
MKISIIMPTYNDASTILETIDSVASQSYENWQLIIINDGSTDNVENVINQYRENSKHKDKIEYYYQENQDQLNAISNGIKYINGDYVYILHSDDLLPDDNFLQKMTDVAIQNPKIKVFIGDLVTIDENSNYSGDLKVAKYIKSKKVLPTLMLWLGRNLYVDVIFAKKDTFVNEIYNSYLTWNMPFWTKLDEKADMLEVKNIDFPMLKYRVHGGNYINDEMGKLNVINGELRTITRLMEFYNIPLYKLQFYIYRLFNKLKLSSIFCPIYLNKQEKNKGEVVQFVIQKRFGNDYTNNLFLNNLVKFYKSSTKRKIYINEIKDNEYIYKGKDMRLFNKNLLNNNLSNLYNSLIKEMKNGFDEIVVHSEENKVKMIDITKFLCIYPYVKVIVQDKKI